VALVSEEFSETNGHVIACTLPNEIVRIKIKTILLVDHIHLVCSIRKSIDNFVSLLHSHFEVCFNFKQMNHFLRKKILYFKILSALLHFNEAVNQKIRVLGTFVVLILISSRAGRVTSQVRSMQP
jgi:hypothetical protein